MLTYLPIHPLRARRAPAGANNNNNNNDALRMRMLHAWKSRMKTLTCSSDMSARIVGADGCSACGASPASDVSISSSVGDRC